MTIFDEIKQDLPVVYNEVEEVLTNLIQMTDEEFLDTKSSSIKRLEDALYWLDKYVDDEDLIR